MTNLICPYCGSRALKTSGSEIYPHRTDLKRLPFYRCAPCDAHVGCHPGSDKPLGRLADAQLRREKQAAHAAFDPLWRSGEMSRRGAYGWLAERLGIPRHDCHIGMFDVQMCRRVVEICVAREFKSEA